MELLANIYRPKNLSEVIGQTHLIGPDKILTNLVNNGKIYSMILYGKPGIGKTSIANAIVLELNIVFIQEEQLLYSPNVEVHLPR